MEEGIYTKCECSFKEENKFVGCNCEFRTQDKVIGNVTIDEIRI